MAYLISASFKTLDVGKQLILKWVTFLVLGFSNSYNKIHILIHKLDWREIKWSNDQYKYKINCKYKHKNTVDILDQIQCPFPAQGNNNFFSC